MTPASEVKVWDPLIRVFHWATVTLCQLNFFVLEEGSKPHRYAGYAVGILLIIRLLWGLVGPYYARFGQWWPTPARVRYYLRQLAAAAEAAGKSPATWDAFWGEEWLEELHGIIANTLMAAVGVHAAVVLLTDRLTRSDLVRAMVLGKKRVPANIKVEDPRA